MKKVVLPPHILLLSSQGTSARMDINALRSLNTGKITHFNDAEQGLKFILQHAEFEETKITKAQNSAASSSLSGGMGSSVDFSIVSHLTRNKIGLIICHEKVGQMAILEFLQKLTFVSPTFKTPLLLISGSKQSTANLVQTNLVVLERPFTPQVLVTSMLQAVGMDNFTNPLPAAKKIPSKDRPLVAKSNMQSVAELFAKGSALVQSKNFTQARQCYTQILLRQPDNAKAHLALANLYKKDNSELLAQKHTLLAAATYLRLRQPERAAHVAEGLPKSMRQGNLFAYEALFYLDDKDFRNAAHSFLEAASIEPERAIHEIIGRTCQFTASPEQNLQHTCTAFEKMGKSTLANTLRHRLLTHRQPEHREPLTWLDNFPKLKEALSIATYTASVWRHA